MINNHKSTENLNVAGINPGDSNVEFVGVRNTKSVLWLQNGNSHYFSDLPIQYFLLLKAAYQKDHKAVRFLSKVTDCEKRKVELFTYYMYGDLDTTPDIKNGSLTGSENFRDLDNCPSLLWNSKNINIGNYILSPRQLIIIDLIAKDLPDKAIAHSLNVAINTLDYHKAKLFKVLKVTNKVALLKLAFQYKIIK